MKKKKIIIHKNFKHLRIHFLLAALAVATATATATATTTATATAAATATATHLKIQLRPRQLRVVRNEASYLNFRFFGFLRERWPYYLFFRIVQG